MCHRGARPEDGEIGAGVTVLPCAAPYAAWLSSDRRPASVRRPPERAEPEIARGVARLASRLLVVIGIRVDEEETLRVLVQSVRVRGRPPAG
jgi:hypothetical protein